MRSDSYDLRSLNGCGNRQREGKRHRQFRWRGKEPADVNDSGSVAVRVSSMVAAFVNKSRT